ncbi:MULTISPECIES: sugar ABC transporter permease [Streptomyces]|uniref:sugar ABC transporter permease n=1 Tax=Streptomyces scabiei TaxID=1930 RepID=UPI0004E636F9|nr:MULTISPECIES: ABC transporter permease [Streptomyces]MBP5860463.1 sugar ABC transporter permease [Streptomyces sp. LBUM 1484]MBP5870566.1 sugar ABC transporter permease [Streptomyces sp. LBUM 1485]MBP5909182.1 sugar ABC transporter permease [Streptomyces sp. LBUM 1478]MBP5927946.1 sugar ABC transporter permease [Streptomyces sp. LBUM 1479]KFG09087.1 ABC transporter permease [Streptomyces scabiei]
MSDTSKTVKSDSPGTAAEGQTTVAPADDPTAAPVTVVDPRLLIREEGLKGYVTEFKRKVKGGELGSLPVVIGLIVIWTIFQLQNDRFLSADNLSNISYFLSATGMLAIGLVFVLLLGEIDLSVGSVSGLASTVFAVLAVNQGLSSWLAVVLAILTGIAIGALHGWFFARVGVPAFVVTLAGFLGWNGLMLWLLGDSGTINIPSDTGPIRLLGQSSFFMDQAIIGAWLLAGLAVVLSLVGNLNEQRRRRAAGVPFRATSEILLRVGALAVASFASAAVLNNASGVSNALVIFLAALVIVDFVLRRTTYGRKVFAVGGGIEAARRAGINVPMIRITVFAISGGFAAIGGMFFAGQTASATLSAGSGNILMLAIAAAVIGGTSLFGGRGSVWSALLGMLVIQSIQTGLDLLNMNTSIQYMITGAVLLGAVVIDSVSRRSQKAAGRA